MANTIKNGPEFDIPLVESIDYNLQPMEYIEAVEADLDSNAYFRYNSSQLKELHDTMWAALRQIGVTQDWYFDKVAGLELRIHELRKKEDPTATIKPLLEELARDLPRFSQIPVIEELDESDLQERASSYFTTSRSNSQKEYRSSTEQIVTLKK
jgi:hypothetical protein